MFSYHLQTHIDIHASPQDVWSVLVGFERYSDWNPMLKNVQTDLCVGSPVSFEVLTGKSNSLKLKAKITIVDEATELNWAGGSVVAISGRHYFRLEKMGQDQVRLHHGEVFKGLLLPLLKRALQKSESLYREMNKALKKRVET